MTPSRARASSGPAPWAARALAVYRRTGADLPFGDPGRAHGVAMEGYYWRLTGGGRVIVALCGVCIDATGPWATVALAVHPERRLITYLAPIAAADPDRLATTAGDALHGSADRLDVRLDGARLSATFSERVAWPYRAWGALGAAHWLPAIGQYWHPHLLGARVHGTLELDGTAIDLTGMRAYAEKNWGTAFPARWWWGEAHDFPDASVTVAFAGGGLRAGLSATAVVVRLDDRVLRFGAPTALVTARADPHRWTLRGRSARHEVIVEGEARDAPYILPVPIPAQRRSVDRAHQQLAGEIRLTVRRGRRILFRGECPSAGLEFGD